jgi:hypothetical protein
VAEAGHPFLKKMWSGVLINDDDECISNSIPKNGIHRELRTRKQSIGMMPFCANPFEPMMTMSVSITPFLRMGYIEELPTRKLSTRMMPFCANLLYIGNSSQVCNMI